MKDTTERKGTWWCSRCSHKVAVIRYGNKRNKTYLCLDCSQQYALTNMLKKKIV